MSLRSIVFRLWTHGRAGLRNWQPASKILSESVRREASSTPAQRHYETARQILANNILRRVTNPVSSDLRKRTTKQLFYGNSTPFFAFVGISLASGSIISKEDELDGLCWEIREAVERMEGSVSEAESDLFESGENAELNGFVIGPLIGKGANAAVYAARKAEQAERESNEGGPKFDTVSPLSAFPFAMKMMFNFDAESNATAILRSMFRETIPARMHCISGDFVPWMQSMYEDLSVVPPHANVVAMHCAFVDSVAELPDSISQYPAALPQRINPSGYGHNKTLFLLMKRTVFSVDINKERYKTLESTCKRFGLEGVCHPINMDALKVSAEICPNVEYIIVDPPCSGTGMMSVLVRHTADEGRLSKLSNLQAMILKHALSQFPSARRIVYSTCSIQEEENEQVVGECLSVAEQNGFQLVPLGGSLRGSFSQGIGSSRVAASVLRLSPQYHLTNGFFIALFERSTPPKIPLFKSKTETLSKSETNKYEALKEDSLSSYSVSNSEDEICDEDKDIILKKSDVKSRNRNKPTVENSRENSRLLKKNSSAKNINKTCLSKGTKQSNTLSSIKCIKIEYTHSRQIKKKILPKKQLRKK